MDCTGFVQHFGFKRERFSVGTVGQLILCGSCTSCAKQFSVFGVDGSCVTFVLVDIWRVTAMLLLFGRAALILLFARAGYI